MSVKTIQRRALRARLVREIADRAAKAYIQINPENYTPDEHAAAAAFRDGFMSGWRARSTRLTSDIAQRRALNDKTITDMASWGAFE